MAEGKADIIDITPRLGNTDSDVAPKIHIKATTGLPEGIIEVPPEEGVFTRARRAFSRVLDRIDTNKENKPPLGKAF